MKNSRGTPQKLISLFAFVLFACNLLPPSSNPPGVQPAGPSSSQDDSFYSQLGQTSSTGQVEFNDPAVPAPLLVTIEDSQSGNPLSNIQVAFLSDGDKFLLIAYDTDRQYLPVLHEYNYSDLDFTAAGKTATPRKAAFALILGLLNVIDAINTAQDWATYFGDPPDLVYWGFVYNDYCANTEQMGNALQAYVSTLLLVIPGPTSKLPKATDLLEEAFFTALKVLEWVAGEEIQAALASKINTLDERSPSIIRWRILNPALVPFLIAMPVDWCLEPLERNNADSIREWVIYGLEKQDMFPFESLAIDDDFWYANYIEGGQPVTRTELLEDLAQRLSSQPTCVFYELSPFYEGGPLNLHIWTEGWSPPMLMHFAQYVGPPTYYDPPFESSSVGFFFYEKERQFKFSNLYINSPENYYFVDEGLQYNPCDQPIGSGRGVPSATLPTPTNTSQSPAIAPTHYPLAGCAPSQIRRGDIGYISLSGGRNAIRSTPDTSPSNNILGHAEPGEVVFILDGPECNFGWLLWEVKTLQGLTGWTPETNGTDFWITPFENFSACNGSKTTALAVGKRAVVNYDPPTANTVRNDPSTSADAIGRIHPGEVVQILDGPVCADGYLWWQVRSTAQNLTGWTAEGNNREHWLAPQP